MTSTDRARRRAGLVLGAFGVLLLLTCFACALLAIWTGDGRFEETAALTGFFGFGSAVIGFLPMQGVL